MKIQDIKQDSKPTEVTYATVSVRGVAGFAGAINCEERNVTKAVKAIKEDTIIRYGGKVETFRKFIELENGQVIRLFWSNGEPSTQFNNFRKAI
jgi:hypothetical protein